MTPEAHKYAAAAGLFCFVTTENGEQQDIYNFTTVPGVYLLFQKSRFGTVLCRCGKKLGGLTAVQAKNAQVTIEKACQIIQSPVQLQNTERVRRGQRHGTPEDQMYWALMRDSFEEKKKERSP